MSTILTVRSDWNDSPSTDLQTRGLPSISWHVLWTRSNCEQVVYDQLSARGFDLFLPKIAAWGRRSGTQCVSRIPLFPGYLFLRHSLDKASYIEVSRTTGLVRLLGDRWDQLAVVPDSEVEAIQAVVRAPLPMFPHPYLREGQRVRITNGPLANVEGLFVRRRANKGLLIVSVEMLRRSVAVEVECTWVEVASS